MVLLAHWPIDDGYFGAPTVARDIAGGGSGAHDGVPNISSASYSYGNYRPGGVGGHHMHKRANSYEGSIASIANPSDFLLLGNIAVSCWVAPDGYYYWYSYDRVFATCEGDQNSELEADNMLWEFRTNNGATGGRGLSFLWEYGAGNDVRVDSISLASWPIQGWCHVGAERYEVTPGFWGVRFYVNGVLVDDQNNGGSGWPAPTGGANALPFVARKNTSNGGYREWFYDSVRVYDSLIGAAGMANDVNADLAAGAIGDGLGGAIKSDWPAKPLPENYLYPGGDHYPQIPAGTLSTRDGAGYTR